MADDRVTATLEEIQQRNEHWIKTMGLTGASVEDSPFGDNRLLVAAVGHVLQLHRPDPFRTALCNDCEAQWPCPTYMAISSALLGSQTAPAGEGKDDG